MAGVECKHIHLPITEENEVFSGLEVGDCVVFSGHILCGRDAVLPKVCALFDEKCIGDIPADFAGAAIFHTAVSGAGVGPTSSNKLEIEESFGPLCDAGVKVFLGKGALKQETVDKMAAAGAVYAVVPPVTALLGRGMTSKRLVAFPELGMEALYAIELSECPAVVAAVGGRSMYEAGDK